MAAIPAPATVTATLNDAKTAVTIDWTAPDGGWAAGTSFEVTAAEKVRGTQVRYTQAASPLPLDNLAPGAYTFDVRATTVDGKSDPTSSAEVVVPETTVSGLWTTLSWWFCALWALAAVVFLLMMAVDSKRDHIFGSLALASGVMFAGLIFVALAGGRYGVWRPFLGDDRRMSTSRTQIGLWTLLIAFVLVFFAGRTWFGKEQHLYDGFPTSANTTTPTTVAPTPTTEIPTTLPTTTSGGTTTTVASTTPTTAAESVPSSSSSSSATIWDEYLLLLGGPFAALVLARGIVSSKITNGTVQKTVADDGTANVLQILQNDGGNPDLVDTQYFLFNLVAFAFVVIALAKTDRLPEIPAILLALTGSSAAAYVLNKAIDQSIPSITGLLPTSAHPGDRVVLQGVNLAPAGSTVPTSVTVGGVNAVVEAGATDSSLSFIVPAGVAAGATPVIAYTGANASTTPLTMQILEDKPTVTSISPFGAVPPADVTLDGWYLTDLDTSNEVGVSFGGPSVPAQVIRVSGSLQRIVVATAGVAPSSTVQIVVRTQRGKSSDAFSYTFGP